MIYLRVHSITSHIIDDLVSIPSSREFYNISINKKVTLRPGAEESGREIDSRSEFSVTAAT
jgi:hypothetical protein